MKTKKSKVIKEKEPTLFRKLIDIHHEHALAKKAMRNLSKLNWSVDFLCHIVLEECLWQLLRICRERRYARGIM